MVVRLADRRIVDTEHDDGCPAELKAVLMSFATHPRVDMPATPPVALAPAGDAERARADLVPFSVEVQRHGDVAVVEPRGELDVATVLTLRAIVEEKSPGRLVLDLRGLSFIDSSGLHLLVALHQRAQSDGFQLALVAPAPPVDRAIQVSGLGKTLPFVSPSAIE